ncbi:EamA family transporter [Candidatus Parcubacteria bacterium]|nr:EamA family transporter [Candidatus Parcubacteria bacterium]
MELWHLLITGSVFTMVTGQFIGKIFINKLHPYQILFYQYIASISLVSIYIYFLKQSDAFFDIPIWFIVIGFMYAIGITSKYHAQKQSLSKTSIMANFTSFIPIILSILFLSEYKIFYIEGLEGIKKVTGLTLTAVALYFFYKKKSHHGSEESFNFKIWIKWISIHVLIIGLASFIVKYAVNLHEPLSILRLQYLGSFIFIILICLYSKTNLRIGWKNIVGSMFIGFFISSSLAMLYTSLSIASATQVFSISTISTTVALTIIGILFFKEKLTKKMLLPFIISIVAIYLLK